MLVHIQATPLPVQLPLMHLGKATDDSSAWAAATQAGDPDETLHSLLLPSLALAIATIWGVHQW